MVSPGFNSYQDDTRAFKRRFGAETPLLWNWTGSARSATSVDDMSEGNSESRGTAG